LNFHVSKIRDYSKNERQQFIYTTNVKREGPPPNPLQRGKFTAFSILGLFYDYFLFINHRSKEGVFRFPLRRGIKGEDAQKLF